MEAEFGVPSGYKFKPKKEELFYFLWQKLNGQPLSCGEYAIRELDVYDETQLEEIFLKGERQYCPVHVFTRRKNKGKTGNKHKDRKVGNGTWKAQQKGELEGFGGWRDFRYVNFKCKRRHHKWNMTEYFLDEDRYPNLQDYAISCVKKKYIKERDQEKNELTDPNEEQEKEERTASESFVGYLNRVLMSPTRQFETLGIPQPHGETMHNALTCTTNPYVVPALMEEPPQDATNNNDTNVVSASMEYLNRVLLSPIQQLETLGIPQPHYETNQNAITSTDPYIVPVLMEEPLQIATSNTDDTNGVSASMKEPLQTAITNTGINSVPLTIAIADTDTDTMPASIEEAESTAGPAGESNNLLAEADKALQSDDLNSTSWIDDMFKDDMENESELFPLVDEESDFFPWY